MTERPVKCLVVDDIKENLLSLEALLKRDGLELVKAGSGPEALERLLVDEFALALLDVQMPGMDGFELAQLMQGTERTRRIPIIFLTAGGIDEQRRFRGYGAGAVDFLFKPIDPQILQSKVEVFIELYRQRQAVERQRDELRVAAADNARLLSEIQQLNESLEQRVEERTTQLLEANEQLQGFTYSVAHDFRQHIRGININASMLLEDLGGEAGPHRKYLERLQDIAQLMGQMTDDLLSYARLRTEAIQVTDVDLSALAIEAAESRQTIYPKSQFRVEPNLHACGDRTMLRIVMENLVDNALKYSQFAERPLVEAGRDDEGFYVKDNGVGFDPAFADKLFRPFERLHVGTRYQGTGIGLANVKRIVERHGGRIWATSKPEHGSTFHFSLQ